MPTIATVTPALWLARFAHLERGVGKGNFVACLENQRPEDRHLLPLTDGVGGHKGRNSWRVQPVIGGLHEPARDIVERLPALVRPSKIAVKVFFLFVCSPVDLSKEDYRRYTSRHLHSQNQFVLDPMET